MWMVRICSPHIIIIIITIIIITIIYNGLVLPLNCYFFQRIVLQNISPRSILVFFTHLPLTS